MVDAKGIGEFFVTSDKVNASCNTGEEHDFDEIVRLHYERIASLVRRLIGDCADVDDIVQEVFVRAYEALPNFRSECDIGTWLTRIAINLSRNYRRDMRRRRVLPMSELALHDEEFDGDAVGVVSSPEEEVIAAKERAKLRAALDQLPEAQRIPIIMRFFEDMTYAQIAEALGCPESTIRSRVTAGLKRLAKLLRNCE